MKYKIFKYDSKNTGYYYYETDKLKDAQDRRRHFKHIRIDGTDGFFQEYENGKLTSWSLVGNGKNPLALQTN